MVSTQSGAVLLSADSLSGDLLSGLASDPTLLSFPAEACGGPGDNTSYAALRGVVWRLHACFNCKSFSRLLCIFIPALFVEFE